jgi:hypothetical protein
MNLDNNNDHHNNNIVKSPNHRVVVLWNETIQPTWDPQHSKAPCVLSLFTAGAGAAKHKPHGDNNG